MQACCSLTLCPENCIIPIDKVLVRLRVMEAERRGSLHLLRQDFLRGALQAANSNRRYAEELDDAPAAGDLLQVRGLAGGRSRPADQRSARTPRSMCPSPRWPSWVTSAARSPGTRCATTCPRGRSRARTRSTCRRPRATSARVRSAPMIRPSWEVDRSVRAVHRADDPAGGPRWSGRETASTAQLRRRLDELVRLPDVRPTSTRTGAVLSTGTCLVPPMPFTLSDGDVIGIGIDEVGRLVTPVVRGLDPMRWLASRS